MSLEIIMFGMMISLVVITTFNDSRIARLEDLLNGDEEQEDEE